MLCSGIITLKEASAFPSAFFSEVHPADVKMKASASRNMAAAFFPVDVILILIGTRPSI
jgi:hypothetical protein